jgi:Mg/Co/Ni transporter MgtE
MAKKTNEMTVKEIIKSIEEETKLPKVTEYFMVLDNSNTKSSGCITNMSLPEMVSAIISTITSYPGLKEEFMKISLKK